MLPPGSRHPAQSFPRCHSERSEESRSCSGAIPWRHLMAPAGGAAPLRSCRAVGRVSRTGVTRHRSPSSDYATLIRPTTLGEAVKIALTLPSPRGRGKEECASFWRHLMAPAGGAAPQSRTLFGGRGLSERSEFRSLSPHFSPASCYGRRSTRCAGAYSRKPLRHSVQLCLQRLAVRAPQHNGVSTPSRRSLVRNAGSPSGLG